MELCISCALVFVKYTLLFLVIAFTSLYISNLLLDLSVTAKLGSKIKFLFKLFKIPPSLAPVVASSLIDVRVEHAMLYSYYSRRVVDENFIVYYVLVLSPLRMIRILPVYIMPLSIAALGLYGGVVYSILTFLKSLLSSLIGYIYGKLRVHINTSLQDSKTSLSYVESPIKTGLHAGRLSLLLKRTFIKTLSLFKQLSIRILVVSIIMMLLYLFNVFNIISSYLSIVFSNVLSPILTPKLITLIVTGTINPTLGMFTAGALLSSGDITLKEALIALLISNFLFTLLFEFTRHSFPFYASIYPVKLAARLTMWHIVCSAVATPVLVSLVLVMF